MEPTSNFILLLGSSLLLPFLAVLALLLRRSIVLGKMRLVIFVLAILTIAILLYEDFVEHGASFGPAQATIAVITSFLTYLLLSRTSHHHTHESKEKGIKALVLAESFHSLFDGAALGIAFLASPVLGVGALLGIVVHELPKILATLALIRASGLSMKKTLFYGAISQMGVPISASLVYLIGESTLTEFHFIDLAVISSLATIVLYIFYKEMRHHMKINRGKHEHH